ncbi:hypothetical protein V8E54_008824 [Elaphomyces granulatus]
MDSPEPKESVDETEAELDSNRDAHSSLKHQLLGPSLTKAGQDSVDQRKVSEIIYNASKGSKFFNHEEARDRSLTSKIERILSLKARLEKVDLTTELRRADEYIAELEHERDLSQTVVHIDCDAFFAAVEELDRPDLKTVPMAVGRGVITTCNYHARKFGCRSGMAAFVAKKLCPHLICLPQNFDKYNAKAREIRAILADYDPRFESASIDEAYLNLTAYCAENNLGPEEAVHRMRAEVLEKTKLTVSAGIGANAKIAKIASNRNKPNGQFRVLNDRASIMTFMGDLSVRKVNGIGRVFERELDAVGIKTCGDIYRYRSMLTKLFGEKAFQFLIHAYLGLGRTRIQPAEEYERKSVGTESTFSETGDRQQIRDKLRWAAEELEKDLSRTQFRGRTLVLKVKLHTFEVLTRQTVPPRAVHLAHDLYTFALPMLVKLEKELPYMKIRLLGLRCTNLLSTKRTGNNFFNLNPSLMPSQPIEWRPVERDPDPEQEFEQAARQERQDDMNELEILSQELSLDSESLDPTKDDTEGDSSPRHIDTSNQSWDCPICRRPYPSEDKSFNAHVDFCLSQQKIKELVKRSSLEPLPVKSQSRKRKISSNMKGLTSSSRQKRGYFH